jgi:hypothetical protein
VSEPFLITGLPRSRTAWMAEVATFGRAVCFHEPMARLERWSEIFALWGAQSGACFVGIADHGLGFFLPEIMRRAAPRTLIIERPIEEVEASLDLIGVPGSRLFLELLSKALAYPHPRIGRVPYASLSDSNVVRYCLQWLMPGAPIDIDRIAAMQRENIQALENIQAGRQRAADIANFLPADVIARLRAAA